MFKISSSRIKIRVKSKGEGARLTLDNHIMFIEYEPLPVVNSPGEALQSHAPLIHETRYQPQIVLGEIR